MPFMGCNLNILYKLLHMCRENKNKKQHFSSYLLSKGNKPYAVLTYTLCRILIALIHKSAGLTWIDNKKVTA